MLFSSLIFLYAFLPGLLLLYFVFRNSVIRKCLLIIFSLVFYAWGEPIYIFLMLMVVTLNYLFGLLIDESENSEKRKNYLVLGLSLNLLVLVFFKYSGLIINTLNQISFINIPEIKVKLPLGISFYIFQALTYIVDVYRKEIPCQKKYSSLILYISFFPQLIAGPIVKYKDIEKELEERIFNADDAFSGLFKFSIGLAKKVLLANTLGKAASILLDVNNFSNLSIWVGMIFFMLQLYFDFSGYSDMAIGLGRIFGFHYKENFNYPYISKGITDFWRRWHISLSSFFREYVYIPLGGKYHLQIRNIFIVWALTGLWHGASWNFCLWGIYFAIVLIIEKYFIGVCKSIEKKEILNEQIRAKEQEKEQEVKQVLVEAGKQGRSRKRKATETQVIRKPFFGNIIFKNTILKNTFVHIYTILVLIIGFVLFYFENIATIQLAYIQMFSFATNKINLISLSAIRENVIILILAIIGCTPFVRFIVSKISSKINKNLTTIFTVIVIIIFFVLSTISIVGDTYNPFLYFRF